MRGKEELEESVKMGQEEGGKVGRMGRAEGQKVGGRLGEGQQKQQSSLGCK